MNRNMTVAMIVAATMLIGSGTALAKPKEAEGKTTPVLECPMAAAHGLEMTPEKFEIMRGIEKEYNRAVGPLKDQLKAKRLELGALSKNPNTQPELLSKVSGEIGTLLGQIRTTKNARDDRFEKELGFIPKKMKNDKRGRHDARPMPHTAPMQQTAPQTEAPANAS